MTSENKVSFFEKVGDRVAKVLHRPIQKTFSFSKEEMAQWRKDNPTAMDLLGIKSNDYIKRAIDGREGFSFKVLKTFAKNMELTQSEVGELVGLNKTKLERRKASGRLNWNEADKLLAVANVLDITKRLKWRNVFTAEWLRTPNEKYFSGRSPLSIAKTEMGRLKVNEVVFDIIEAKSRPQA